MDEGVDEFLCNQASHSLSSKLNTSILVQCKGVTQNVKWVMTPQGVNSVHYPPYFEIIYGTFKIDHSKAVDIITHGL